MKKESLPKIMKGELQEEEIAKEEVLKQPESEESSPQSASEMVKPREAVAQDAPQKEELEEQPQDEPQAETLPVDDAEEVSRETATKTSPPEASVEEILLQLNYIAPEDMEEARKMAPNGKVIDFLLDQKKINKDILGQAVAEYNNMTYFDLNTAGIPKENFFAVSMTAAKSLRMVITSLKEAEIEVTTDVPRNKDQIMEVITQSYPEHKITLLYSLPEDMDEAFKVYREGLQKRLDNVLASDDPNFAAVYFDELVRDALEQKASDIHIEPNPENVLIRFRVDGILQEMAAMSHDYYENILNRIKVLSNIRLDEHYRAQDGAIRYKIDDMPIDLRVSIAPIMEGQKVVIRILADYIKNMALPDLGLNKANFELIQRASKKTYGMILTTGPTGSGKTTTLYSLLKILNRPEVNITTIEDPVEYRILGVNQIQVNMENEITFAK